MIYDTRFLISFFTDEIIDVLRTVNNHRYARVLVLSAQGTAFSPGGNIKDMKEKRVFSKGGPAGIRRSYLVGIQRIPKALYALEISTISAVQSPVIGAGGKLALYCDITICSTEAKFGETFINVGIIPGDGGF